MMPVRVAYDLLGQAEAAGGVGRYARELAGTLAARDDVALRLLIPRSDPAGLRAEPWASAVRFTAVPDRLARPPMGLGSAFATGAALGLARLADVLHAPANVGAVRVPGLASVVTVHDLIWMHAGADWGSPEAVRAIARVSGPVARHADRVLADSEAAAHELRALLGVSAERLDVAPLGVRVDPDAPATAEADLRERLDLGAGPVVLCVAQKRPYKSQDTLIRALGALPPDVRLVLPGTPTAYEDRLRDLAGELGVSERVRFPAWVDAPDLEGLYRLATCFILPSTLEGFGLPVLEAMARGVPVACSDRASLPEVAGDAALLFDPAVQDEVTGAVGRLLAEPALRERLAAAGRARAAQFTWERTAELTVAAYRRAVAGR